jgi:hypothetical protein
MACSKRPNIDRQYRGWKHMIASYFIIECYRYSYSEDSLRYMLYIKPCHVKCGVTFERFEASFICGVSLDSPSCCVTLTTLVSSCTQLLLMAISIVKKKKSHTFVHSISCSFSYGSNWLFHCNRMLVDICIDF